MCKKNFFYLGDTLDGGCGANLAVIARIRNEWKELLPFLSLKMKGRVYASCVKSSMTYGSETIPLLADVVLKLEKAEM